MPTSATTRCWPPGWSDLRAGSSPWSRTPENCRLLLSSLRLNDITNVQLLPVAADTATGWAYYSTHVGSNGGLIEDGDLLSHPGNVVPTFRLDDLVDGPVGLLKMDVEGAEGRVVQGATRIIERDRPIVTTELKDEMLRRVSGTTVADYLGYFEKLGYTPSVLEKATGAEKPYAVGGRAAGRLGRSPTSCVTSCFSPARPEPASVEAHPGSVQIRVEGHHLPGASCGPGPDYPNGHPNIHVAVQRRNKPAELLGLVRGDAATADLDARVHRRRDGFRGRPRRAPTSRAREVGGSSTSPGASSAPTRRSPCSAGPSSCSTAVPPDVLRSAVASGLLVGTLGLTDETGHPRCAAVRPPLIEWSAGT